jgi:hypothetical protein
VETLPDLHIPHAPHIPLAHTQPRLYKLHNNNKELNPVHPASPLKAHACIIDGIIMWKASRVCAVSSTEPGAQHFHRTTTPQPSVLYNSYRGVVHATLQWRTGCIKRVLVMAVLFGLLGCVLSKCGDTYCLHVQSAWIGLSYKDKGNMSDIQYGTPGCNAGTFQHDTLLKLRKHHHLTNKLVPVAARSKAEVCGRSPAEIVGSDPTESMDVCLLWVLCVVRLRSLKRVDHWSRGVLPNCNVSLCVI